MVRATWTRLLAWRWWRACSASRAARCGRLVQRDTTAVLYSGVDAISRTHGHVYHTQVYDLAQQRRLWSGEGRSEDTLRRFFTSDDAAGAAGGEARGAA